MASFTNTAYGLSTQRDEDWREKARCRDEDPDLWFPIGNTGPALAQTEMAKTICRTCPVLAECLRWAIDSGQPYGIAGGATPHERKGMGAVLRDPEPAAPVRCRRQRHWMTSANVYVDEFRHRHCMACRAESKRASRMRRERVSA
jgi:WhiB family redox-sensing transcriptional regulator